MGYSSRLGHARISSREPEAAAQCDRCGAIYNHVDLHWQHDWRGAAMQNLRILVCRRCTDEPQDQQRTLVVPLDPPPIIGARPEGFVNAEIDYQTVSAPITLDPVTGIPVYSPVTLATQDGHTLTSQPLGANPRGHRIGLEQDAVMPMENRLPYAVSLPVVSVLANGTDQINVTCSQAINVAPYNLATNAQVAIEGLTNKEACGFFSIVLITATSFSYQINKAIPAGSLLDIETVVTG